MLRRIVAAVAIVAAITSAASAQDVKLPRIEFGRYHALVIGNNDYQHLRKLSIAVGVPAYGAGHACRDVVADRLAELGIDSAEVSGIDYIRIKSDRRGGGRVVGVEAWVSFRNCRGNLVIIMDRHCRIKRTYGRGDCRAYLNEAG